MISSTFGPWFRVAFLKIYAQSHFYKLSYFPMFSYLAICFFSLKKNEITEKYWNRRKYLPICKKHREEEIFNIALFCNMHSSLFFLLKFLAKNVLFIAVQRKAKSYVYHTADLTNLVPHVH